MNVINTVDGSFLMNYKFKIEKEMSETEVINSLVRLKCEYNLTDMRTGWKWIHFIDKAEDSSIISFELGFHEKIIKMLIFSFYNDLKEMNWENYNLEKNKEKLKLLEVWITEEVGSQRQFPWGNICVENNDKDGIPCISIVYK